MPVRLVVASFAALLLSAVPAAVPAAAAPPTAAGYVPAQFVAKVYTEGLGRAPDQAAWSAAEHGFAANGCNAGSLATFGTQVYTAAEFTALGYGHPAAVLALYRGALNREPDQQGYSAAVAALDGGRPWPQVVHDLFAGAEFVRLAPRICSGVVDGSGSSYGVGGQPALTLPTAGAGFAGTGAQLQAALDAGAPVALAPQAVVRLSKPLVLPAGGVLDTTGAPDPRHYAAMGRLVPAGPFDGPLLIVGPGAAVRHVWVDGNRAPGAASAPARSAVRIDGGTNTAFTDDKVSNTAGPQSILALGTYDGFACGGMSVARNLVTVYSSDNYRKSAWSDGISVSCEDADIADNQIVDPSDVGIVLYRAGSVPQRSRAHGNVVLSAGNSAYGGLVVDPLYVTGSQPPQAYGFGGATITGNTLWTGPDTHFDIALGVGTRAWFGPKTNNGTGSTVTDNTTGTLGARVQTGIGVGGMRGVSIGGNTLQLTHPARIGRCPAAAVALDPATAAGTVSPAPDVRRGFDLCIGHTGSAVRPGGGYTSTISIKSSTPDRSAGFRV